MVLAVLTLGLASVADTITLRDGDQLSGSLVEISDGIGVFRTELAGQIMLPISRIASVSTTRDVQIVFKDGGRGVGRLVTTGGEMQFVPKHDGGPYPVEMSMLVSVAPIRGETGPNGAEDATSAVSIGTGVQATSGNDDYVSLYARLRLAVGRPDFDWAGDILLATGAGGDSLGELRLETLWRWRPESRLRPTLGLALEHEPDELLDSRVSLFAGGFADLWESPAQELSGLLAIAVESEHWSADHLDEREVFPNDGWEGTRAAMYYRAADLARDETALRLRFDLRHRVRLFDRITWEEQISLYPNLGDFSDWRSAYESTVLYPLADRLLLNLSLRVDYDNEPAFRYLDQWRTRVGAGVEWRF